MKISVIGCGYLGAVHASSLAKLGHVVVGIDIDQAKIDLLSSAKAPFYEPGLPELLSETLATGALTFSTDMRLARGAAVHFVAVGTPQQEDSNAVDLRAVESAFEAIVLQVSPGDVVVGKSTVPVGTAQRLAELVEAAGAHLVWNPEFLREGYAVKDTISPDRLVYGVRPGDDHSVAVLDEVYASALAQEIPRVVTDFATSELVKVAANAFLATKISFINAMAEVAEVTGADVTQLADAIGYDQRIGRRFLNAGLGFGGGCLPKDIRGFMARASELGAGDALNFLGEVDAINLRRRERMVDLCREVLGGNIEGAKIAVLGLAFKPDSDDVRDSPALDVAARLAELGGNVRATDPQAVETSRRLRPELDYVATAEEAARDADVVLVLTEWREYRNIDPVALGSVVSVRAILDGRNCLDPVQWREAGWTYRALGRP
ncbi:UDP-glucose/GDP-mannose dehydrogenase family protein [Salinibacterium sp. M195]|uniref:UDP-glucose dehydrogenase family protein n=1 Tax=Salinibacterium sp. M195 TaxID=2583374 RepID=UPI001C62628B|nr:UDP-glucose/GDP-mannose dehydrogenase family protein [Salinibacterium sp. M195]QYH35591.1 UDP-glucose/GDP-mannose dehydrogenase family protein [Salinibacterium sp. M195]